MDDQSQFNELISRYKLPLGMGIVGLVLLIGGIVSSGIIPKTFIKSSKTAPGVVEGATISKPEQFITKVDVSGAVASPGVYTLPAGSRIEDAIKIAGGVTASADLNYLSKNLNLAQKVSDGMKVYIPKTEEAGKSATPVASGESSVSSLININSATAEELDKLPGVGSTTAQNIIGKRPYGSIEELLTKKAVSRAVYEKIKGAISAY